MSVVETMIVLGGSAVLLVLLLGPFLRASRSSVAATQCIGNLRQLGAAIFLYAAEHHGELPAVSGDAAAATEDERNGKGLQWDAQIGEYLPVVRPVYRTPQTRTVFFCPSSRPDPSYANRAIVALSYTYNGQLGKTETTPGVRLSAGQERASVMVLADLELSSSTQEFSYVPQTGQGRNNTIVFRPASSYYRFLAYRHQKKANLLFLDGAVEGRQRLEEHNPATPPEAVRWVPGGSLTGRR